MVLSDVCDVVKFIEFKKLKDVRMNLELIGFVVVCVLSDGKFEVYVDLVFEYVLYKNKDFKMFVICFWIN